MTHLPSAATQLDRAFDAVLDGHPPTVAAAAAIDRPLRPLVALGESIRGAMPPLPVSARFEARLGARLAQAAEGRQAGSWAASHQVLLLSGAVGSAALGVGITAFAVWRHGRRPAPSAFRLLHR